MDLRQYDETFGKHVSGSMYGCSNDKHVPGCARVLPSHYKTYSEYVSDCARVLLSYDKTICEHEHDCTRVLPSNEETFSKHESDSMNGCVVDKLFPSHFIIRQVT